MWITPKDKKDSPRSQSKLERFFDQQTKAQALVRESIQNSFDALLEDEQTLNVSFNFKNFQKSVYDAYMKGEGDTLYRHLSECGIDVNSNFKKSLLIEDFKTEGLSGPLDKSEWTEEEEPKPVSGNFIGFWWSEGISEKSRGSAGSHGVGKITLSTSSDLKTFFALSNRADDDLEILIGYSQLKYHYFDRQAFQEHSRFGKWKEDGIFPFDSKKDNDLIEGFKNNFGIKRGTETGTSILIPSVNDEITFKEIIKATLLEYFFPILNQSLQVKVTDDGDLVEINHETIHELTKKYLDESSYELITDAEVVLNKIDNKDYYLPSFDTDLGKVNGKRLEQKDLEESDLEKMKSKFNNGELVGLLVPVEITENKGNKISSRFYLYLKKNDESVLKRSNNFIRDKLLINKESVSISRRYSSIFLYIENKDLSEFLKYAEDPGHERWVYKTLYENGGVKRENDTPLRLIKSIVVDFFNILSGIGDDEKIKGVLPEIFSIEEKSKSARGGKISPEDPPESIRSKSAAPYVIGRLENGYTIKNSNQIKNLISDGLLELPFSVEISLRYEKFSGRKKHSKYDFDLTKDFDIETTIKNVNIDLVTSNQYVIKVNDVDFSFKNIGFDKKRDLVIKCKLIEN